MAQGVAIAFIGLLFAAAAHAAPTWELKSGSGWHLTNRPALAPSHEKILERANSSCSTARSARQKTHRKLAQIAQGIPPCATAPSICSASATTSWATSFYLHNFEELLDTYPR